jgi:hypothetical protein
MSIVMPMAKTDKGKPYIRVILTPELEEQLERWKELSGTSYASAARYALLEYLAVKLKDHPKKREG